MNLNHDYLILPCPALPNLWHGDEFCVFLVLLADIGQPTEDQHPHDHHQHQQPELLVAETQQFPQYLHQRDVFFLPIFEGHTKCL